MKLTVLGTESPYYTKSRVCPCFLIEEDDQKILLDCGFGSSRFLNYPQIFDNLNIIISHLHYDHCADLNAIQYALLCLKKENKEINVYLPASPEVDYDFYTSRLLERTNFHIITKNNTINIGNIKIEFMQTFHLIETYAIKITSKNKTVVYTADYNFDTENKMTEFAKNADLLISESTLLENNHASGLEKVHISSFRTGRIAKNAGVKKLLLTHFSVGDNRQTHLLEAQKSFNNVEVVNENDVFYI